MSNKHDLTEYLIAKEVTRDLPKIRDILVKTIDNLTPYKKYRDAAQVINQAEDAIIMCDLQIALYLPIVTNKGKISE